MEQIQYDTRPGEFADAMASIRAARLLFWLVCGLAAAGQLSAFLLVEFGGVLDTDKAAAVLAKAAERAPAAPAPAPAAAPGPAAPATPPPAKTPATPPARPATPPTAPPKTAAEPAKPATPPAAAATKAPAKPAAPPAPAKLPALTTAQKWDLALTWALPVTQFVAMVMAILLVVTIGFAVQLSLVGKLGGAAALLSSFFWAHILLTMLVPWQQILTRASLPAGALFTLGELQLGRAAAGDPAAGWQQEVLYFARFAAYPGVALLVWLVVHAKFSRGCSLMDFPHAVAASATVRGVVAAGPAPAPVAMPTAPAPVAPATPLTTTPGAHRSHAAMAPTAAAAAPGPAPAAPAPTSAAAAVFEIPTASEPKADKKAPKPSKPSAMSRLADRLFLPKPGSDQQADAADGQSKDEKTEELRT